MFDYFFTLLAIGIITALGASIIGGCLWLIRQGWIKTFQKPLRKPPQTIPNACSICDFHPLPPVVLVHYVVLVLQGLPRGTKVKIISGSYAGRTGTVEATVFQKTVDYPDELAHGYHVTLDDGTWVTVRVDQVRAAGPGKAMI